MTIVNGGEHDTYPDCFGYHDVGDPSCRRCNLAEECVEHQDSMLPECFGKLYDDEEVECKNCLFSSRCADEMEDKDKMTKRRRVRMRRTATADVEPEPESEEEVEFEEEAGEDVDYADMRVSELREECEDRDLDPVGRKSVLIRRLMEDDGDKVEDEDDENEPEPQIKRRKVASNKSNEPPPGSNDNPVVGFSLDDVVDALEAGKSIIVTVTEKGYVISMGGTVTAQQAQEEPKPKRKGLRGDEFWREVLTEDYYDFNKVDCGTGKPWEKMSKEEKVEFAEELDVTWEEMDSDLVTTMNMVKAVYAELGIEKYKEEYKSPSARKALR